MEEIWGKDKEDGKALGEGWGGREGEVGGWRAKNQMKIEISKI